MKKLASVLVAFAIGVACGGVLFSGTIPRQIVDLDACSDGCLDTSAIAGLLTSAAIRHVPFAIPDVVAESDTCIAIRHPNPAPEEQAHYVLFTKRDIRNIGEVMPADLRYVEGCLALARQLIRRDALKFYRLSTNGPGFQDIAFLHFHLISSSSGQ